jgi:hypothetical protein
MSRQREGVMVAFTVGPDAISSKGSSITSDTMKEITWTGKKHCYRCNVMMICYRLTEDYFTMRSDTLKEIIFTGKNNCYTRLKEDYFTMRSDMMKEITFTGKMIVMD